MAASSWSALCSLKRKRTVVSLETKVAILDRLKKGETQVRLVSEYGIGTSTVFDIKKNEEKILDSATTMDSLDRVRRYRISSNRTLPRIKPGLV